MDENTKNFFLLRMENHFDSTFVDLEEATTVLREGVNSSISKGGIIYEVVRPIYTYGDVTDL